MKYLAIILLAYTCGVIGKPIGEQQPASPETTNLSAPTVITDYSSIAKSELPKEAGKSEITAPLQPVPAAQAEQIPTGKDAKELISETSSELSSAAAAGPGGVAEVKKVAEDSPIQDTSSISSESSSSEEHVPIPAKIVETSPTHDVVKSEEETVKAVAEVALTNNKEEEKKMVAAAADAPAAPAAVTSEAPKESNSQVNSVSVDEPKPTELKSQTTENLGKSEKIETPAAAIETGDKSAELSAAPEAAAVEQKKSQSSEETSSEEKLSSSEEKSESVPAAVVPALAAAAPAPAAEKLPVPEPIKPVESEAPKIDSVKSEAPLIEAPKEAILPAPAATEQLANPAPAAIAPAAPAPAEEVKELPQPLGKPAEEQKPAPAAAASMTEEKKEKLVVKRETQKYEDEKKPTDGFVKKEEFKKTKIENQKQKTISGITAENFGDAKSEPSSSELGVNSSSEELSPKTPEIADDVKFSSEEDNKSK